MQRTTKEIFKPKRLGRPLMYGHQVIGFKGKKYGRYEYTN